MNNVLPYLNLISTWIWGPPLIILLVGTGLFLSIRLFGLQFRYLYYALKLAFTRGDENAEGDISHFQALMTSLAATIGIGNIVGVATAIATGGLGSIFWMWVTALVGMATKYSEAVLAIKYRIMDKKGEMCGGPMYYIERGMGKKWLAIAFALFASIAAFGIGDMVQANSVAAAISDIYPISSLYTGVILAMFTGFVLIGGIKSIGRVASFLVPIMAALYMLSGIIILFKNASQVPVAISQIFSQAFTGAAATGGFIGSTIMMTVRMGVSRGVFSNEAGLGSAPIAAAAAKTDMPGRQAMVSMVGTFLDTIVVCSVTALVIAVTGVLGDHDAEGNLLNGAHMTVAAFAKGVQGGGVIVTVGLILFAYSTILGWAYYGEKCFEYLFKERSIIFYRILFTILIIPGSIFSMQTVWAISDIMNGLMAFPNLIALLALSGVIAKETNKFLAVVHKEKSAKYHRIANLE